MEDEWAAKWAIDKITENSEVRSASIISPGILEIVRTRYDPFHSAILGIKGKVNQSHIDRFAGSGGSIAFFANIPGDSIWTGPAINSVRAIPAAFGGLGDLVRSIRNCPNVTEYRNKELAFFEDGLAQHSAVYQVDQLFDRKFNVRRRNKPDFSVVLVDAYDMSAEDVRNAKTVYGDFDAAVKMSSYGSITPQAEAAAKSMGAGTYKWGQLLGRLNRK
mgnify:CR=1 FL=1